MYWKTTSLAINMWSLNTGDLWWQVHYIIVQWNLSWGTTAMRDHLSWKTTHFCRRTNISIQLSLLTETTCLERPHFVAKGVAFPDRFYCITVSARNQWSFKAGFTVPDTDTCTDMPYTFYVSQGPPTWLLGASSSGPTLHRAPPHRCLEPRL